MNDKAIKVGWSVLVRDHGFGETVVQHNRVELSLTIDKKPSKKELERIMAALMDCVNTISRAR